MLVRIRLSHGPRIRRKRGSKRRLALGFATLLTPAAVAASVLAIWRIAADMKLAQAFAIREGLFSHWQVWVVVAIILEGIAIQLTRYGNSGGTEPPTDTSAGGRQRAASTGDHTSLSNSRQPDPLSGNAETHGIYNPGRPEKTRLRSR